MPETEATSKRGLVPKKGHKSSAYNSEQNFVMFRDYKLDTIARLLLRDG